MLVDWEKKNTSWKCVKNVAQKIEKQVLATARM